MGKLEDALWDADAALRKLEPEQSRIKRRNARTKMLAALRKARAALDEEFPGIRKPVTRRRKPKRRRKLQGKAEIRESEMQTLLLAGVSANNFDRAPRQPAKRGGVTTSPTVWWAPHWMVRALRHDISADEITNAVRSQKKRRAIKALIRLRSMKGLGLP